MHYLLNIILYAEMVHCTGKTGKMTKKMPCQGKHRESENVAKTQGIWFAQVVNFQFSEGFLMKHSLYLRLHDYSRL